MHNKLPLLASRTDSGRWLLSRRPGHSVDEGDKFMERFEYLSPRWFEATRAVRGEYRSNHEPDVSYVGNLTITAVPSLNGDSATFHVDLSLPLFYDAGHVENADFSLVTDFETAREIYQDDSWGLVRLSDAYADGTLQATGDIDVVREFWIEVIRDPDHVTVFDQIMAFTA
jgi:hypothetical protein